MSSTPRPTRRAGALRLRSPSKSLIRPHGLEQPERPSHVVFRMSSGDLSVWLFDQNDPGHQETSVLSLDTMISSIRGDMIEYRG